MYVFHSKTTTPNRNERVTFVGEFENGLLKIASSRCSKKDQFNRKKGRTIAEGRLLKNKLIFQKEMTDCSGANFLDITRELSSEIIRTKQVFLVHKENSEEVLPKN